MDKYSLEFRCSNRVTIIVTNHVNHYMLKETIILEIDSDCILHTEPVHLTTGYATKREAVETALRMMDQVELAILELMQEQPIGGIEPYEGREPEDRSWEESSVPDVYGF